MMNSEKRNYERKNLASQLISGRFSILTSAKEICFSEVNDVSISGMGIVIDHLLDLQEPVKINYQSSEFSVCINAKIIWQKKLEKGKYQIGVDFSSENMDDNVMLFMTLREFIDDFGETF